MTDVTIVRGGAIALARAADRRYAELERAVTQLLAARAAAERALARARHACELAEQMGRYAGRAMSGDIDPDDLRQVAALVEQLCASPNVQRTGTDG